MEATTAPLFQDDAQPSDAVIDLPETKSACIVAIDPGLTGAVAFYFPSTPDRIAVEDMPVVNGEVDVHGLERMFRRMGATRGVIELVGPMPKDGSVQAFKFGMSFGMARTALALTHLPFTMVTPQTWKRHHGLIGKADPKEAGRALAIRLFPACSEHFARKKDHGRADAALLARYAAEVLR